MQSLYLPLALPSPVISLKYRSGLPYVGLRSSPFVPVLCPPCAFANSITVTQRCRKIKVEAKQRDIFISDKQQVEDEYLLVAGLKAESMPKHIGVIPDGNRRWARQKGWPEKFGHMSLASLVKDLSRLCCKCGIKVLTAFLFSSDNWKHSQVEAL